MRHDLPAARVAELKPRGLIFSGGPASVYEPGAPHCDPEIFDLGMPVLGICYGMQLACQSLGGEVKPARQPRVRPGPLPHPRKPTACSPACPQETIVWMSHGDQVQTVNGDFVPLAATDTCPVAAVRHAAGRSSACSSIPRSATRRTAARSCTTSSTRSAAATGLWQMQSFIEQTVADMRAARRQRTGSSAACPAASIRR